jgi:hypothetical protein
MPRWHRLRRFAPSVVVLALAMLTFMAGLLLDTTAVLRLTFGWTARVWDRVPFAAALAVAVLVTATLFVLSRETAATPAPGTRRPAAKRRAEEKPARPREAAERVRQEVAPEQPEPAAPVPDTDAAVQPAKRATRRKSVKAGA